MTFTRFVAIDWTGAVGERHRAIAVAEAGPEGPPRLVRPGHRWSRAEVFGMIEAARVAGERALFGIDMCFGFPFTDRGAFFPGETDSPADARALWREVAAVAAADPHHAVGAYVAHRRRHFWLGAADGPRGERARLRTVERADQSNGNTPSSVFVLLGAAQCGKASLSGMRLLAETRTPVWPMDRSSGTARCWSRFIAAYSRSTAERGASCEHATRWIPRWPSWAARRPRACPSISTTISATR